MVSNTLGGIQVDFADITTSAIASIVLGDIVSESFSTLGFHVPAVVCPSSRRVRNRLYTWGVWRRPCNVACLSRRMPGRRNTIDVRHP